MKKHIVRILIIALVLSVIGVGAYYIVKNTKKKPLYSTHQTFVSSTSAKKLIENIEATESLYQLKVASGETRLTTLRNVIIKLDSFEKDLNVYLTISSSKNSTSNKLSKKYQTLSKERENLIENYAEYITRLSGNINIDGNGSQKLYNEIFDKTVKYLYNYNACFNSNSTYVFEKVYKVDTIKSELYSLYSAAVSNLLNNISNHQFDNINLINSLNSKINLINNNISISSAIDGGEFSTEALNFKRHYNLSNINALVETFKTINVTSINPATETSNEKLAIYYASKLLEV